MAWYDPILILVFVAGFLLIAFSHYHHRRAFLWGLILILASLIAKVSIWLAGLI